MNFLNKIFTSQIKGIHKEMGLHPITLKFRDSREKDFLDYYFLYSLDFVRISLLFSIIFYLIFFALDVVIFPEYKLTFFLIRFIVTFPIAFFIFLITYNKQFAKNWQSLLFLLVQVAGIAIIAMIFYSSKTYQYNYYVGLLLVLMYNYMFSKLRFIWATLSGWLQFTLYAFALYFYFDIPFENSYMDLFFYASANVFGMTAAYFTEYYSRREFYIIFLLNNEKRKVEHFNQQLEIKVEERTKELKEINKQLIEKNKALNASEKELSRHKSELEELVKLRTHELQSQYEQLGEKNEELKKFNDLFVGREFRIKELRDQITELKKQISELNTD
ncbi:MAG: hypothetical protein R2759_13855 [Bacteroidales bacterium]